jgi:hypothetical protein
MNYEAMPLLLGLSGRRGVGKDVLGRLLSLSYGYERVALADEVKRDVAKMYHTDVEEIEAEKELFRPDLVAHGMGMRRVDPDYWLKAAGIPGRRTATVVTDVRMENEVRAIREEGGLVFFVLAVGEPLVDPNPETSAAEQLMPHWADFVVPHERTFESLLHSWLFICEKLAYPPPSYESAEAWLDEMHRKQSGRFR